MCDSAGRDIRQLTPCEYLSTLSGINEPLGERTESLPVAVRPSWSSLGWLAQDIAPVSEVFLSKCGQASVKTKDNLLRSSRSM